MVISENIEKVIRTPPPIGGGSMEFNDPINPQLVSIDGRSMFLIAQYKYFKSCSGDFIRQL